MKRTFEQRLEEENTYFTYDIFFSQIFTSFKTIKQDGSSVSEMLVPAITYKTDKQQWSFENIQIFP